MRMRPAGWLLVLATALLGGGLLRAPSARADAGTATERWYEMQELGQKVGHSRVVWAPSTWEGRKTLHDTTTFVRRSVRNMMGVRDVFETIVTVDIERAPDGTLWWRRDVVEEAGRVTTSEIRWTGEGYVSISRLDEAEQTVEIPLDAPVMTDSESFLGTFVRDGSMEVGARYEMPQLDVRARGRRMARLEVVGREPVEGLDGEVEAWRIRETDVESGSSLVLWLDDDGALVRLVSDSGRVFQRVARQQAETAPVETAEFRITTPAAPVLERVMSADRLLVDVHLQGDADRALPDFPESPWSRTLGREGSDEAGWVYHLELTKYDHPDATTTLPLDDVTPFERELEETVLMPWRDARVRRVVEQVVGEETDARVAATLLARWVYESLTKQSPEVAQASATEILEAGCGDCSEHALLYVTLCRAAGIPARRCSGFVCVGSQWGAHAWAEIWLGRWVGADPTTGEVGTSARYIFYGYPGLPGSNPGVVSSRAAGRMRIVTRRVEEGDDAYDLDGPEDWHIHDHVARRYVHVLAGIEARDVPADWVVRMSGIKRALIRAADLRCTVDIAADQGATLAQLGGANDTFAGQPARTFHMGDGAVVYVLHSRRRIVQVRVNGQSDTLEERLATLERVLAPTFAPVPRAPRDEEADEAAAPVPAPGDDEEAPEGPAER